MKQMMIMAIAALTLTAGYLATSCPTACAAEAKKQMLRVGTYDSRGIAIGYRNSDHWGKVMEEKKAALEQAKKEGDTEKVKEFKAWFPAQQAKAHLEGFGTAPVHGYLEVVKDQVPAVAQAAGVDIIVSKWETDYLAAGAETVDVTMELAKLFEPKEKAYQWIEQMKDKAPIDHKEIQRLEKEDPNF